MDVRIILKVFAFGIVRDVEQLGAEVVFIANPMLMITGVPDAARSLIRKCEGVAALDELNALCRAYIDCRSNEDVDMVRHNGEAVQEEFPGIAVTEKRDDEELGVFSAQEVAVAAGGQDCDGVGAELLSGRGHP